MANQAKNAILLQGIRNAQKDTKINRVLNKGIQVSNYMKVGTKEYNNVKRILQENADNYGKTVFKSITEKDANLKAVVNMSAKELAADFLSDYHDIAKLTENKELQTAVKNAEVLIEVQFQDLLKTFKEFSSISPEVGNISGLTKKQAAKVVSELSA